MFLLQLLFRVVSDFMSNLVCDESNDGSDADDDDEDDEGYDVARLSHCA